MTNKLFWVTVTCYFFCCNAIHAQIDSSKVLKANILGINHIGVTVENLERSYRFYKKTFGLDVAEAKFLKKGTKSEKQAGLGVLDRKIVVLEGPNAGIELMEFDQKGANNLLAIPGPGITHICYQVPSTKPVYDKFATAGATIISRGDKPIDLGGYGIYYTYVRDPDQVLFENEQMDKPHFEEDTWIGHVAIATKNIDKMVDFYSKFLDKKPHRRSVVNKDNSKLDAIGNVDNIRLKGAWFRTENMVFEFWEYQNPKPAEITEPKPLNDIGYSYIAFEVANIQNEYKRLKMNGLEILSKVNSSKYIKEFLMRDPEGNLLLIQELKSERSLKYKKKLMEK